METVLDFRIFDTRFKSGLFFSLIEGLLQGNKIKVIFDQDPEFLRQQFDAAKIVNSQWYSKKIKESLWEVCVSKNSQQPHSECCGICGNG